MSVRFFFLLFRRSTRVGLVTRTAAAADQTSVVTDCTRFSLLRHESISDDHWSIAFTKTISLWTVYVDKAWYDVRITIRQGNFF